jgi:outer membrane protease
VSAVDHHVLRDLIFKDEFAKGVMSAYKVGLGYNVTKRFEVSLRYDSYKYDEVRGNTTYIDSPTGIPFAYCLNCAGADNSNQSLSIGISYVY